MKRFLKVGGFLVALLMVAAMGYAQTLTVGSDSGVLGDTLTIPVTFTNDLNDVVGINFDVNFPTALVNITGATAGSALPVSFGFSTSEPSPGIRRIIIIPPLTTPLPPIPSGEIAVLTVNIVGASGTAPLALANVIMSDNVGGAVTPAALIDGTITINETTHTVTFTAGAGGSLTGTTTQVVNDGDDCTPVTAVPDAGYLFTGWTGDHVGIENPLTITNVTSDMNITANFAPPGSHTVTFTAGSGGSLTGTTTQVVNEGDDCTPVTAVPDAGYLFTGWTGDHVGIENPLTITNVTSNMNITANFAVSGGPAAAVPTLNEWGMIILMGSFFILALYILRRRNTAGT